MEHYSTERLTLMTKSMVLCNHILRLNNINEGYWGLPYGSDESGNSRPFTLTVYTDSENIRLLIKEKKKILVTEITRAHRWAFDRAVDEIFRVYGYPPYGLNRPTFRAKVEEWEINDIEIKPLVQVPSWMKGDTLSNLAVQAKNTAGYDYGEYNIPDPTPLKHTHIQRW